MAKKAMAKQAGSQKAAAVATQASQEATPLEVFEAAMKKFQARDFAAAKVLFEEASKGKTPGMAHRARLQATICERRLGLAEVEFRTAEDHYNYGVAQLGQRTLETAREHLQTALAMEPHADHVHYALALCEAMAGNPEGAALHLRAAIDVQPNNRIAVRQDADFVPYLGHPRIAAVLLATKPA